uniref:TROVE domain-containing protein n=1 Tax=Macrostomum lignano TaxID=282301 RepID=A0A1I8JR97_9PLAT
ISVPSDDEGSAAREERREKLFTLKQLVRQLHINKASRSRDVPDRKRYPDSLAEFYKTGLPGEFDATRRASGCACGAARPGRRRCPPVATRRVKHHNMVLSGLQDEGSVINSKQFPFRFFSAYQALDVLEARAHGDYSFTVCSQFMTVCSQFIDGDTVDHSSFTRRPLPSWPSSRQRRRVQERRSPVGEVAAGGRGSGRGGRGGRGGGGGGDREQKKAQKAMAGFSSDMIDWIARYRKALEAAVKVATTYNVPPIKGSTCLLVTGYPDMDLPCTSYRGMGKPRTVMEVAILLGLMCKHACEQCDFRVFLTSSMTEVGLSKGGILENLNDVVLQLGAQPWCSHHLYSLLAGRKQVDTLLLLSNTDWSMDAGVKAFCGAVDPNLLFVNVDLFWQGASVKPSEADEATMNDVSVAGFSDQILRFISQRGARGHPGHTWTPPTSATYNCRRIFRESTAAAGGGLRVAGGGAAAPGVPDSPLGSVRVFISSTFRDMHGERDLLTRCLFPQLRRECRKMFVELLEVDLRWWGVTEEEARREVPGAIFSWTRCAALRPETATGFTPASYAAPADPAFDWVRDCPPGRSSPSWRCATPCSATAATRPALRSTAFFLLREPLHQAKCPQPGAIGSNPSRSRRSARCGRAEGVWWLDGRPLLTGWRTWAAACTPAYLLALQARSVTALTRTNDDDGRRGASGFRDEAEHTEGLQAASCSAAGRLCWPRDAGQSAEEVLGSVRSACGARSGAPGCGKTAFIEKTVEFERHAVRAPASQCGASPLFGASPGSNFIHPTLQRICHELARRFGLGDLPAQCSFKSPGGALLGASDSVGKRGKFTIFIDGFELMEDINEAKSFSWLPVPLPETHKIYPTEHRGGDHGERELHGGTSPCSVGRTSTSSALVCWTLLDRSEIMQQMLAKFSKSLDEAAFNNQMRLITGKKPVRPASLSAPLRRRIGLGCRLLLLLARDGLSESELRLWRCQCSAAQEPPASWDHRIASWMTQPSSSSCGARDAAGLPVWALCFGNGGVENAASLIRLQGEDACRAVRERYLAGAAAAAASPSASVVVVFLRFSTANPNGRCCGSARSMEASQRFQDYKQFAFDCVNHLTKTRIRPAPAGPRGPSARAIRCGANKRTFQPCQRPANTSPASSPWTAFLFDADLPLAADSVGRPPVGPSPATWCSQSDTGREIKSLSATAPSGHRVCLLAPAPDRLANGVKGRLRQPVGTPAAGLRLGTSRATVTALVRPIGGGPVRSAAAWTDSCCLLRNAATGVAELPAS